MVDMRILVSTTVAMVMMITVSGTVQDCLQAMASCYDGTAPTSMTDLQKATYERICVSDSAKQEYIDQSECSYKIILESDKCKVLRDSSLIVKQDWDNHRKALDYDCDHLPAIYRSLACLLKDSSAVSKCINTILSKLSDYERLEKYCKLVGMTLDDCMNTSVLKSCDADDLAIAVKGDKMRVPDVCGYDSAAQKPLLSFLTLFIGLLIVRLF